jgi:multidrug efflux system membrane fusion protein
MDNNKRGSFLGSKKGVGLTGLVAAAAIAAGVFGVQRSGAEAPATEPAPQAVPVSVATVTQSDVATWDEFSGRLEAVERVDVRPRVAGTVQAVHFREGALVRDGDLLVTIDPAPYAAEVDRAEAEVVSAEASLAYATSDLARAERLWQERAIAQREYDERDHARRAAEAALRAARANLQTARLSLGYTKVKAPVSGRVGKLEITVGNLVSAGPNAPVLTTLVSVNPIYASFEADEQVVMRALRGLPGGNGARAQLERIPVELRTASHETPLEGRLQLVDNQVDTRSGTIRVRAVFDNKDGNLIPGQFARLRMGQAKSEPALLVNERAVGTDQDKKFVMVIGADNKAAYREVTLGPPANGLRVVTGGLKPGERIVVNGLQRVRPGALVEPRPVAMDAKPEVTARRAGSSQS